MTDSEKTFDEKTSGEKVEFMVNEILQMLIDRGITLGEAESIGKKIFRRTSGFVPGSLALKDYLKICQQ